MVRRYWLVVGLLGVLMVAAGMGAGVGGMRGGRAAVPALTDPPILTAWIFNTTGQTNPHFTGPVNVQSVQQISVGGVPYVQVHTNSLADYYTTMTAGMIQELNSRPRAATDFTQGHTTATVGQVVRFGDNIGYNSAGCGWATGRRGRAVPRRATARSTSRCNRCRRRRRFRPRWGHRAVGRRHGGLQLVGRAVVQQRACLVERGDGL